MNEQMQKNNEDNPVKSITKGMAHENTNKYYEYCIWYIDIGYYE